MAAGICRSLSSSDSNIWRQKQHCVVGDSERLRFQGTERGRRQASVLGVDQEVLVLAFWVPGADLASFYDLTVVCMAAKLPWRGVRCQIECHLSGHNIGASKQEEPFDTCCVGAGKRKAITISCRIQQRNDVNLETHSQIKKTEAAPVSGPLTYIPCLRQVIWKQEPHHAVVTPDILQPGANSLSNTIPAKPLM